MKLTETQQEIIDDLSGGSIIYCYHEYGETKYRTMRGTCERLNLSKVTLRCLIEKGAIVPVGNGLFGDTQTWRLADGD